MKRIAVFVSSTGMMLTAFVCEAYVWGEQGNVPLPSSWETSRYSTDKTAVPYWRQKETPDSLLTLLPQNDEVQKSNACSELWRHGGAGYAY